LVVDRKDVMEYCTSVKRVEFALLEAMSESLGLEKDYIDKMLYNHGQKISMNYYPICQEQDLEFTRGVRHHTDPTIITILLQDNVPGFKVLNNGKWVDVGHIPNTLVIHVGDLLQVIHFIYKVMLNIIYIYIYIYEEKKTLRYT
jgi:isopenicillin N synthase-like dioxygenase